MQRTNTTQEQKNKLSNKKQAEDMKRDLSKEDMQITNQHLKMLNITNYKGNANSNHNTPHSQNSYQQKSTSNMCAEDVDKRDSLGTIGGTTNWYSNCGKQIPKKMKRSNIQPSNSISGNSKKMKTLI